MKQKLKNNIEIRSSLENENITFVDNSSDASKEYYYTPRRERRKRQRSDASNDHIEQGLSVQRPSTSDQHTSAYTYRRLYAAHTNMSVGSAGDKAPFTSRSQRPPCRQLDRADDATASATSGALPPTSLPLHVRRRRSCRPLMVGLLADELEDEAAATASSGTAEQTQRQTADVSNRRIGGGGSSGIGRRHSVSFMPSAAPRRRRANNYDDDDDEEVGDKGVQLADDSWKPRRREVTHKDDDVSDDDSSPEHRRLQRTPTPYYEDPPSMIALPDDHVTAENKSPAEVEFDSSDTDDADHDEGVVVGRNRRAIDATSKLDDDVIVPGPVVYLLRDPIDKICDQVGKECRIVTTNSSTDGEICDDDVICKAAPTVVDRQ